MANPILSRSEVFEKAPQSPQGPQFLPPQQEYQAGYQQTQPGYGYQMPDPQAQAAFNQYGYDQRITPQQMPQMQGVITIDDVVAKTAISLGAVLVVAALTFLFIPQQVIVPLVWGSAIASLIAVMILSFRSTLSPLGVMVYALFEGAFIGAISKMLDVLYPGIAVSALFSTFVTAGIVLAGYKFFNIRVTAKFRKIVFFATAGAAGAMLVNLVLMWVGVNTGMREIGPQAGVLSYVVSVICVVLAVLNLVADFDYVERAIQNRAPASESWRAALGITVTMVWLYVEILRVLSYFRR